MSILFLSHQAKFIYGGEICTMELMRELVKTRKVYFAAPEGPYTERVRTELSEVSLLILPSVEFSRSLGSLRFLPGALQATDRALREFVAREGISWVHATSLKAMVYAWRLGRAKVSVLWHHHDIMPDTFWNKAWLKGIAAGARRIVVPSAAAKDALVVAGVDSAKVSVVYNGVPLEQWKQRKSLARDRIVMAYVGEISARKGVDALVPLAKALAAALPGRAELRILGAPLSEPEFGAAVLASLRALEPAVVYLGKRSDVAEQLQEVDLLLVPSRQDPLPTVIVEALASGVPVVARAVGGIPEMLDDGQEGRLFREDHELPELVLGLLREGALPKLAARARDRAERQFSVRSMATQVGELYERG